MNKKASVQMQFKGYAPAYRDTIVKFTHEATGTSFERKAFLDGSLQIRGLDPGFYEIEVWHPNLTFPIERRRVRIFGQMGSTKVDIPIPKDLFTNSPIRDIPDVDLGPVQKSAQDVQTRLEPIAFKEAGEAILAADWRLLVGGVQDLAKAVLELTNLVSPKGHDHPEIAEKIAEVQENLRKFAEAFGKSLLELQREIETENLHNTAKDVLEAGGASDALRESILGRIQNLKESTQINTAAFTQQLSNVAAAILNGLNEMAISMGDEADDFLGRSDTKRLGGMAETYFTAGSQTRAEDELRMYGRTTAASGGGKVAGATGGLFGGVSDKSFT